MSSREDQDYRRRLSLESATHLSSSSHNAAVENLATMHIDEESVRTGIFKLRQRDVEFAARWKCTTQRPQKWKRNDPEIIKFGEDAPRMKREEIKLLMQRMSSNEVPSQLEAIEDVTKMVAVMTGYESIEEIEPIIDPRNDILSFVDMLIEEEDLLWKMAYFVEETLNPDLLTMCLINMNNLIFANHQHSRRLIDLSVIKTFIMLFEMGDDSLAELALLLLGNLSLFEAKARDCIFKEKGVTNILTLIEANARDRINQNACSLKTILWAIYNICCTNPLPSDEVLERVISSLCGLVESLSAMQSGNDKDVIAELLYMILIHLSFHGSDRVIDHIVSQELTLKLMSVWLNMLKSPKPLELILRLLGVIFTRNTGQIKIAMENRMVKYISGMFVNFKKDERSKKLYENVIKETCWLIAHAIALAADGSEIQEVFKEVFEQKLFGHVLDFAKSGTDPPEEAVWLICTVAVRVSSDEVHLWLEKDVIKLMCMNTLVGQDDLVLLILESLSRVLRINKEKYAKWVDWTKIKVLKETRTGEVSDAASSMIVRFWHDEANTFDVSVYELRYVNDDGAVEEASTSYEARTQTRRRRHR